MPGLQIAAVLRLEEDFLNCRKALCDLATARIRQRLPVENQRVLREIDDQRQADRDRQRYLENRGDQVLLYISPPLRTNSTDFSCMPCST